jgi:hypothetical protein
MKGKSGGTALMTPALGGVKLSASHSGHFIVAGCASVGLDAVKKRREEKLLFTLYIV